MLIDNGRKDQRPAQVRPDYGLIYTAAPLNAALTISGRVVATLTVESDCPDTDFIVKLNEVTEDGRALLLMDGVVRAMYRRTVEDRGSARPHRLMPGEPVKVQVDLGEIRHTVPAGARLQVDVVSSNFPRRARNTNSGNPIIARDSDADIRVATNTVRHTAPDSSYIELTIMPDAV